MVKLTRTNLFIIAFGALISLAVIELAIRSSAFFLKPVLKPAATAMIESTDKEKIRVICLGDSNTFGIGAKQGFSYPEQLQGMLDKNDPGKYKVYNLGEPGSNSSMLLKRFPGWVRRYRPHIAVVLTGMNDLWNPEESDYYLYLKDADKLSSRVKQFLFKFRTYKLFQLCLINIKYGEKGLSARASIKDTGFNADIARELEIAGKLVEKDPVMARAMCEKMLTKAPSDSRVYAILAKSYFYPSGYELAEKYYLKSIQLDPGNMMALKDLALLYGAQRSPKKKKNILAKMLKNDPSSEAAYSMYVFGLADDSFVPGLLYNNIEKLFLSAEDNNVKLVLQRYPFKRPIIDDVLNRIKDKYKIPVVDNVSVFAKLEYKKYSVPDSHPNEKGYGVMAGNVVNTLHELRVIGSHGM